MRADDWRLKDARAKGLQHVGKLARLCPRPRHHDLPARERPRLEPAQLVGKLRYRTDDRNDRRPQASRRRPRGDIADAAAHNLLVGARSPAHAGCRGLRRLARRHELVHVRREVGGAHQDQQRVGARREPPIGPAAVTGIAGRHDEHVRGHAPLRHGNPRIRRRSDCRRDPGHDGERHSRQLARERLLAAAAEDERVAALQAHDPFPLLRKAHDQGVRFLLAHLVAAGALPGVDELCRGGRATQELVRRQRVVNHGIRRFERTHSGHGDESRITRAGANNPDVAGGHRRSPHAVVSRMESGSIPRSSHQQAYATGEISDGLISLRPPQKTLV